MNRGWLMRSFVSTPDSLERHRSRKPRFYSVAEVAAMFGLSPMTVYRAIAAGEFPAVKIRGRVIVPAGAIDAMIEAATSEGTLVHSADWAAPPDR
jgi:excisionase family DNA binding protein